jgi:hypothetical protein
MVVDRLPGVLSKLKSNQPTCLFLTHHRAVDCVAVWGNVIDTNGDKIPAAQLAIDGKAERC